MSISQIDTVVGIWRRIKAYHACVVHSAFRNIVWLLCALETAFKKTTLESSNFLRTHLACTLTFPARLVGDFLQVTRLMLVNTKMDNIA